MNGPDEIFKEIEHLTTIIQNEERQGEQRVEFFLTLAVASIGLFAFLQKDGALEHTDPYVVVISILAVLLAYGLHTLNRLNWRNVYIRSSHLRMRSAYAELTRIDNRFQSTLELIDKIDDRTTFLRRVRGSTAEFMYMTNAFLLTGIFLSLGLRFCWPSICLWIVCVLTMVVAVIAQYQFSYRYREGLLR